MRRKRGLVGGSCYAYCTKTKWREIKKSIKRVLPWIQCVTSLRSKRKCKQTSKRTAQVDLYKYEIESYTFTGEEKREKEKKKKEEKEEATHGAGVLATTKHERRLSLWQHDHVTKSTGRCKIIWHHLVP